MALRDVRGPRPGRAAGGRAGFVALACALFVGAGLASTWPATPQWRTSFLADGARGHGEPGPGDHLQTAYDLWLVDHQLARGRAPWRDPYSFQPEVAPRINLQGWLFGVPFGVAAWALGPVLAWNLFVVATIVAAGAFAYLWLRELELPSGAALAGGLAFEIAPYRIEQTTGHLLGPISVLLPLALFALERERRSRSGAWGALAAAATVAIPLSGQVHLALGAIPLVLAYAFVRTGDRRVRLAAVAGTAGAVLAGLLVRHVVIRGTIAEGGRTLKEVRVYQADWGDLVTRHIGDRDEAFVFLGWITPIVALGGLAFLLAERRFRLAAFLGAAAVLPVALALGTHLPLYSALWHALAPFRYPRVPERLMPIACLAIAALVAFAVARIPHRMAAVVAIVIVLADLHVEVFRPSAADASNGAYSALRSAGRGRLLELPVFLPGRHENSVYLSYDMQVRRKRPLGYSTVAPRKADSVARTLQPLNCGRWGPEQATLLRQLGVRFVAVHAGLYRRGIRVPARCAEPARRALVENGFSPLARDGAVTIYSRR